MSNLPSIYSACNNKATTVHVGNATYFFSYTTCVGVRYYADDIAINAVSENVWSVTTGRHLNTFSTKSHRVPYALFTEVLTLVSQGDRRSLKRAERLLEQHRAKAAA